MDVIFQDENYIAINKPSGLLSIRDGYQKELPSVKSSLDSEFGRVLTVHRLDKETSGVLVFAKNPIAHRELSLQFEGRKVNKKYLALIFGHPVENKFVIDLPLRINAGRKHRTIVDPVNGKKASTLILLKKILETTSVVEASPSTGYTHQIRSHLLAIGHPIVGDCLYMNQPNFMEGIGDSSRLMLHALYMQFYDSISDQIIEISAPLPPEFLLLERI